MILNVIIEFTERDIQFSSKDGLSRFMMCLDLLRIIVNKVSIGKLTKKTIWNDYGAAINVTNRLYQANDRR